MKINLQKFPKIDLRKPLGNDSTSLGYVMSKKYTTYRFLRGSSEYRELYRHEMEQFSKYASRIIFPETLLCIPNRNVYLTTLTITKDGYLDVCVNELEVEKITNIIRFDKKDGELRVLESEDITSRKQIFDLENTGKIKQLVVKFVHPEIKMLAGLTMRLPAIDSRAKNALFLSREEAELYKTYLMVKNDVEKHNYKNKLRLETYARPNEDTSRGYTGNLSDGPIQTNDYFRPYKNYDRVRADNPEQETQYKDSDVSWTVNY